MPQCIEYTNVVVAQTDPTLSDILFAQVTRQSSNVSSIS